MEPEIEKLLREAHNSVRVADHMIYTTYPMIKDLRILIKVMENLNFSLEKTIEALLYYERLYKRIKTYPDDFISRLDVLKFKVAEKYGINKESLLLVFDIHNFVEARKKSPMEFARRDKYIVCNDEYKIQSIDYKTTKNFLNQTKIFIAKINKILIGVNFQ